MKRGTGDHPKMDELCAALGCRKSTAIGILHLLWEWAADYVPQGDIGKYSDRAIAKAADWDGEPQQLIRGLVQSKWIDEHADHRLIIHDWSEHCEDSTHIKLARQILYFADGSRPRLTRLHKDERKEVEAGYAEREKTRADARKSAPTRTALASPTPMPMPMPGPDAGAGPATPPPSEIPLEERPPLRLAQEILVQCNLPRTFTNQKAVAAAIEAYAEEKTLPDLHEASLALGALAVRAQSASEKVDRWWFEDAKWRNRAGPGRSSCPTDVAFQPPSAVAQAVQQIWADYGLECRYNPDLMVDAATKAGFFAKTGISREETLARMRSDEETHRKIETKRAAAIAAKPG